MTYIIRDREAGNKIAEFFTLQDAQYELEKYEEKDKADDDYTEDFYEIVSTQPNRICDIRKASGLTQKAFGEKYGIPYRTLQNWENGVNEAPDYVVDLLERIVYEDKFHCRLTWGFVIEERNDREAKQFDNTADAMEYGRWYMDDHLTQSERKEVVEAFVGLLGYDEYGDIDSCEVVSTVYEWK